MVVLSDLQKIVEGLYKYKNEGKLFAEESFTYSINPKNEHLYTRAEVSSRTAQGNLLKTIVTSQLNRQHQLIAAQIQTSNGTDKSEQSFIVDDQQGLIHYKFKNKDVQHKQERPWGIKHHLALPCASLSTTYLQVKKFETTKADPILVITTQNELNYIEPLNEKIIWGIWKDLEQKDLTIQQRKLQAPEFLLFEEEPQPTKELDPIIIRPSRHFSIPYLIQGHLGVMIEIEFLKRYELQKY